MLQMGFREPEVVGSAQATASDAVRVRALDPGPSGILGCELGGLLPLPRGLDRLVVGLRPDGELARRVFGPGAGLADRARATGRRVKADAHDGIVRDIPAWGQFDAGMPLGTARLLSIPIQDEGLQVIA